MKLKSTSLLTDEAIDSATVDSLFTSHVIPEPGSIVLLGLSGLLVLRRKR